MRGCRISLLFVLYYFNLVSELLSDLFVDLSVIFLCELSKRSVSATSEESFRESVSDSLSFVSALTVLIPSLITALFSLMPSLITSLFSFIFSVSCSAFP